MKEINLDKIDFADVVNEHFDKWWVKYDDYLYKVCKGGRNSGKSTQIPIRFIRDIIKYPINGLAVRKVGNTLRNSVFENLLEATEMLNIDHYFKDYKSPLRIVYKPTGQEILFRGADDPAKIKSIKTRKFPIAKLWIEELAEFKTESEVKVIVNSVLRSNLKNGLRYSIDMSYNPPKRKTSWVNKLYETKFLPNNVFVHHSTYKENPYCSDDFIEEANEIEKINPLMYEWIYLGKAIGGGLQPFNNIVFREITNEEIETFNNIKQGLDFGWKPSPSHFVRSHFDKKRHDIYALDEIRQQKLVNKILYKDIIDKSYNDVITWGDPADNRSIEELQGYGMRIRPAKKGAGSVEYGTEWLDTMNSIIVDPKRTPWLAKEFENIDYKLDKDGIQTNILDGDHHGIDGLRYAYELEMLANKWGFRDKSGNLI
jgi:PBSX family phage terminase large subunit